MTDTIIGLDIGGTKTTASVCGPQGILARVYQATRKRGDEGTIPRQVRYLVGEACRLAGVDLTRVTALGISTASPFDRREGRLIVVAPNICGGLSRERQLTPNDWTGIPLEEHLAGGYSTLRIGNDCITAAVADVRINGHPERRLPNTLSLSFRDIEANRLLEAIGPAVAASAPRIASRRLEGSSPSSPM